jgi:hypothetical protein
MEGKIEIRIRADFQFVHDPDQGQINRDEFDIPHGQGGFP